MVGNTRILSTIKEIENLLIYSLSINHNDIKNYQWIGEFPEGYPTKPMPKILKKDIPLQPIRKKLPNKPEKQIIPIKPLQKINLPKPIKNAVIFNIFEKFIPYIRENKIKKNNLIYAEETSKWMKQTKDNEYLYSLKVADWEKQVQTIESEYCLAISEWEKQVQTCEDRYSIEINKWKELARNILNYNKQLDCDYEHELNIWKNDINNLNQRKLIFLNEQCEFNQKIENLQKSYSKNNDNSIIEYFDMILKNSKFPDKFPNSFILEYNYITKILIVEYQLPSIECLPTLKDRKYTKDGYKEIHISNSQLLTMFDDAMYKITLRILHEIFETDIADAINAISFNGWVKANNKATGKEENTCILSVQVKKNEFVNLDLYNVDPKICFKSLKGIASTKLHSLTPIQPIMTINKEDKRFVNSYNVSNQIDNSTNIAAMDWEDFEHLIRELFEKEFQSNGGEVKVTQASRDGGVDAIAFDPDPIRGGKSVIQAKRYTNTVGVSAVRDLYGTVINEGATRGILVSTADYGPDAYEFAKGKPIVLLNGSNLLYLLEKHGHHAKIDIKEAKIILAEREKK